MKKNVTLYMLFVITSNFSLTSSFMSLYFNSKNLTLSTIASFFLVYQVTKFVFEIPTGMIADRYGNKISGLTGLLLLMASYLSLLLLANSYGNVLHMLLKGIGYTCISGSIEALFINSVDNEKLIKLNLLERLFYYSSMASSVVLGGYIIKNYGYKQAFAGDFVILIVSFCLVLSMNENKNSQDYENIVNKGIIDKGLDRILIPLFLMDMSTAFSFVAVEDYYSLFLENQYAISSQKAGALIAIQLVAGALFGILVHKIISIKINIDFMMTMVILQIMCVIPFYLFDTKLIMVPILYTLSSVIFSIYAPIKYQIFQSRIASKSRAFFISVQSMMVSVGSILFSLFNWAMAFRYSLNFIMIIALCFTCALDVLVWRMLKKLKSADNIGLE